MSTTCETTPKAAYVRPCVSERGAKVRVSTPDFTSFECSNRNEYARHKNSSRKQWAVARQKLDVVKGGWM